MDEISDVDYDFLHKLGSLEQALKSSVLDPVVIGESCFRMPIDVFEPKEKMYEIMKRRFEVGRSAISGHMRLHGEMVDTFKRLGVRLNSSDSLGVRESTSDLIRSVNLHLATIGAHLFYASDGAFLEYPYVYNGDYFPLPRPLENGDFALNLYCFNPNRTYEGALRELVQLESAAALFFERNPELPEVPIGEYAETPSWLDQTYAGNFALTKMLLYRAREELI